LNAAFGHAGVGLGFAAAVLGIAVVSVGLARGRPSLLRSTRAYAWLLLAGAAVATVAMQHALLTHDFSLQYVYENNSRETPLLYTITGMWSALEGSILLWGLVLAGYTAAMAHHFRRRADDRLVAWATLVTFAVGAYFFGLMLGPADPFKAMPGPLPPDGLGPNPLLQDNPLVAFHPVMLYLGFVGFTIPFAFAAAALVTGRIGEGWLVETRRWTLFAWGFLTVGVILGAWWSYKVLGWGGFWDWDPVENASFLPWLCGTAYIHSVMVQERRGLLRVWNLSLLVATFSLTILGTFLTRSGVVQSVHSFSESTIGPLLLAFFGAVVASGLGLIAWRGDRLRSPEGIESLVSREGAFLANNLVFSVFALVVLLGTVFPLLVQALNGSDVTVGSPYFDTMARPIGLTLLFLMAVAPALPWRRTSSELLRSRLIWPAVLGTATVVACSAAGVRGFTQLLTFGLGAFAGIAAIRQLAISTRAAHRRGSRLWRGLFGRANGGMVVHVGVVVIAVALAAALSYGHRGNVVLRPGQSARFDGHTFSYIGVRRQVRPNQTALIALVRLDGGRVLRPAVSRFGSDTEGVGTPSIATGPAGDVYLSLASSPSPDGTVSLSVVDQPMVMWLWVGGGIVALGTFMAAVPTGRRAGRRPRGQPELRDGAAGGAGRTREPEPAPVIGGDGPPAPVPLAARAEGSRAHWGVEP
jgi:cytochrome c-type biogenesis protein CcmF